MENTLPKNILSRDKAVELLTNYNSSQSLLTHAYAVEAAMLAFAKKFNEDEELWGIVGLIHDLDYEKYPEQHCVKAEEILRENGVDEFYIRAMKSHAYGICSDVEPLSNLEKVLYTIDELTGLINAACLMRPSKSILDIELKSVKKKFKDKSFAAGANREVIKNGCAMLNMELDEVIEITIAGMKAKAEEIGLKGNL